MRRPEGSRCSVPYMLPHSKAGGALLYRGGAWPSSAIKMACRCLCRLHDPTNNSSNDNVEKKKATSIIIITVRKVIIIIITIMITIIIIR